jgi:hypothetical protein
MKEESQKLQTRTLDGCTAPHCRHVFVTGRFCAADASTPVRREPHKDTTNPKKASGFMNDLVFKQTARRNYAVKFRKKERQERNEI